MAESLGARIKAALHLDDSSTTADAGTTGQLHTGTVDSATAASAGPGTDQRSSSQTAGLHEGGVTSQDTGVTNQTTTTTRQSATGAASQSRTGIPVSAVTSSSAAPPNRGDLKTSDEHWEKAQAATEEARRQAKLVEEGARSHAQASEEYYRAEREYTQARHTVEEIETRIRGVNVDAKKAELARAREGYETERKRIASLSQGVQAAHAEADRVQDDANTKGHQLEAEAKESKLYSDRLTGLEAALAEARAAEAEARARAQQHTGALESARLKHDHHRVERDRVSQLLAKLKSELDSVRGREGEATRTLDSHRSEHQHLSEELTALEADALRKREETEHHRAQLDTLGAQRGDLQSLLGQHRSQVSALTKETQDTMARAQAQANSADAKAAELQLTRDQIAVTERNLDQSREALTAAAAESRPLTEQARRTAGLVETQAQEASRLQAELRAAKERVDFAQARKEELWELAKKHGAEADKKSDVHYIKEVAEPHNEDPTPMVTKSDKTETLAGKIEYGVDRVLHHQKDGTVQNPPQVA